ncbi:MAG: hypothetical protein ACPG9K_01040 [Poseidonibacter sp.]
MLDGFFQGSRFLDNRTDKQKIEQRIKDSVLNLVIDRDRSFIDTARRYDTSLIVNNRGGGIQEFNHNNRRYISFPSEMENRFKDMSEYEAEELMDSYVKTALTRLDKDLNDIPSDEELLKEKVWKYKNFTGLETGLEKKLFDEHGNVIDNIFEKRASKTEEEDKKDAEEGEEGSSTGSALGTSGIQDSSSGKHQIMKTDVSKDGKDRTYKFDGVDQNPEGSVLPETDTNRFYNSGNQYTSIEPKREIKLQAIAKQIVKSFKGRVSKNRTSSLSKRLNSKSMITDNTEKIYINKKGDNGKHLSANLIIDMSGSMGGTPVYNAVEMIYIFNEIALAGKLTGKVLWSSTRLYTEVDFPMPRDFIRRMSNVTGGEGLGRNLSKFKDELKKSDFNICMTDGDLVEEPILKELYAKEKIEIYGVYVNKDAEDLTEYTGSLDRWFTKSLARRTIEELSEKIIQLGLRKKGH